MLNRLLSEENKQILIDNAKPVAWRILTYSVVAGSSFATENLHLLNLPAYVSVIIGFGLGELHAWAQSKYDMAGKVAGAFARAGRSTVAAFRGPSRKT